MELAIVNTLGAITSRSLQANNKERKINILLLGTKPI
jgi:hypothetical protein